MPRGDRFGEQPVTLASSIPACGALRHWRRCRLRPCSLSSSTSLRPFAPGPLQALPRSYGRSDSCSPHASRPFPGGEGGLFDEQVSLVTAHDLPAIPSPTTCARSVSPRHVTCRWIEPSSLPSAGYPSGNSGLRHSLADSPHHAGRIEFLIVRTGRSPPAASHPVSPRRSCRLITSYVDSGRTSTSLIVCAIRRTSAGFQSAQEPPRWRRYAQIERLSGRPLH